MVRNKPQLLLQLTIVAGLSFMGALSAGQPQGQTTSLQSQGSLDNRVAAFKATLSNLRDMAKNGQLPVLFEYECVRIADVLDRAHQHLETLAKEAAKDAAAKEQLTTILDMYSGLDTVIAKMTQAQARTLREKASAASEKLRESAVRSPNEASSAAAAVHASIIRSVHPDAFASRKLNIKEMWNEAPVWQKVVAGAGTAVVLVGAGYGSYLLVNKLVGKKSGSSKDTKGKWTLAKQKIKADREATEGDRKELGTLRDKARGEMNVTNRSEYLAKLLTRKEYADLAKKLATEGTEIKTWLDLDLAVHAQRVKDGKAVVFKGDDLVKEAAEMVEYLKGDASKAVAQSGEKALKAIADRAKKAQEAQAKEEARVARNKLRAAAKAQAGNATAEFVVSNGSPIKFKGGLPKSSRTFGDGNASKALRIAGILRDSSKKDEWADARKELFALNKNPDGVKNAAVINDVLKHFCLSDVTCNEDGNLIAEEPAPTTAA